MTNSSTSHKKPSTASRGRKTQTRKRTSRPQQKLPVETSGLRCRMVGCGKVFSRKSLLERHEPSHKELQKHYTPHCCPHCDHKAFQKVNMDQHVKSVHMKLKEICTECGAELSSKSNLIHHQQGVHGKPKMRSDAIARAQARQASSKTRKGAAKKASSKTRKGVAKKASTREADAVGTQAQAQANGHGALLVESLPNAPETSHIPRVPAPVNGPDGERASPSPSIVESHHRLPPIHIPTYQEPSHRFDPPSTLAPAMHMVHRTTGISRVERFHPYSASSSRVRLPSIPQPQRLSYPPATSHSGYTLEQVSPPLQGTWVSPYSVEF